MTEPGIPNDFVLSTACFGSRLASIEDQVFAAVAMGFRSVELGLSEVPPSMDGLRDSQRETGVSITSMVVGCRDPNSSNLACTRLGSLLPQERERAFNSIKRHVRLAESWGCRTVVLRGSRIEDARVLEEIRQIEYRLAHGESTPELSAETVDVVARVQRTGHRQVEHLCRSLHTLMQEVPHMRFAIEPGFGLDDLLGFDAMGWVLDDLERQGIGYWHDVGRVHQRERLGLESQGDWLEAYAPRMLGVHLQDAAENETEMPLGLGEVDFKLVRGYLPSTAQRVLQLNPRHGRVEILRSVQYLMDHGL